MQADHACGCSENRNLEMFIVDVMRHGEIEQVSGILQLLNSRSCIGWRIFWPRDFTAEEVVATLEHLLQKGMVHLLIHDERRRELVDATPESVDLRAEWPTLWFRLTPKGREAWESWEPPKEGK